MANSTDIANAIGVIMPIAKAFIEIAESTGASGEEKHAVVSENLETIYGTLQQSGSIKEIKDVPWELIAPVIVPAGTGLISLIVLAFNKLGHFIKGLFARDDGE
tara:strand:+ start:1736 stop:2047 length:312 start_codon:yes stop_codon:yes gene_type:complete